MTKQEFTEKLSSAGSVSSFMEYSVEGLEAKIHKAYPDKFDMNNIIDFFLTIGGLTFKRSEKKSHDMLTFGLNWKNRVFFHFGAGQIL